MERVLDGLHPLAAEVVIAIIITVSGLSILDDTLAGLAQRIPLVGAVLAPLVRHLSARTRHWLRSAVPASAEDAVRQAEGQLGDGAGVAKNRLAMATLRRREPGLTNTELEREVQAAYERLVGDARLAAHADSTRRRVPKPPPPPPPSRRPPPSEQHT